MEPLTLASLVVLGVVATALLVGGPVRVDGAGVDDVDAAVPPTGLDDRPAEVGECPHCGASNAAEYDYCRDCVRSLNRV
jgi:hypothetical protein